MSSNNKNSYKLSYQRAKQQQQQQQSTSGQVPATRQQTGQPAPATRQQTGQPAPATRQQTGQPGPATRQPAPATRPKTGQPAPTTRQQTGISAPVTRQQTGISAPVTRQQTGPPAPTTRPQTARPAPPATETRPTTPSRIPKPPSPSKEPQVQQKRTPATGFGKIPIPTGKLGRLSQQQLVAPQPQPEPVTPRTPVVPSQIPPVLINDAEFFEADDGGSARTYTIEVEDPHGIQDEPEPVYVTSSADQLATVSARAQSAQVEDGQVHDTQVEGMTTADDALVDSWLQRSHSSTTVVRTGSGITEEAEPPFVRSSVENMEPLVQAAPEPEEPEPIIEEPNPDDDEGFEEIQNEAPESLEEPEVEVEEIFYQEGYFNSASTMLPTTQSRQSETCTLQPETYAQGHHMQSELSFVDALEVLDEEMFDAEEEEKEEGPPSHYGTVSETNANLPGSSYSSSFTQLKNGAALRSLPDLKRSASTSSQGSGRGALEVVDQDQLDVYGYGDEAGVDDNEEGDEDDGIDEPDDDDDEGDEDAAVAQDEEVQEDGDGVEDEIDDDEDMEGMEVEEDAEVDNNVIIVSDDDYYRFEDDELPSQIQKNVHQPTEDELQEPIAYLRQRQSQAMQSLLDLQELKIKDSLTSPTPGTPRVRSSELFLDEEGAPHSYSFNDIRDMVAERDQQQQEQQQQVDSSGRRIRYGRRRVTVGPTSFIYPNGFEEIEDVNLNPVPQQDSGTDTPQGTDTATGGTTTGQQQPPPPESSEEDVLLGVPQGAIRREITQLLSQLETEQQQQQPEEQEQQPQSQQPPQTVPLNEDPVCSAHKLEYSPIEKPSSFNLQGPRFLMLMKSRRDNFRDVVILELVNDSHEIAIFQVIPSCDLHCVISPDEVGLIPPGRKEIVSVKCNYTRGIPEGTLGPPITIQMCPAKFVGEFEDWKAVDFRPQRFYEFWRNLSAEQVAKCKRCVIQRYPIPMNPRYRWTLDSKERFRASTAWEIKVSDNSRGFPSTTLAHVARPIWPGLVIAGLSALYIGMMFGLAYYHHHYYGYPPPAVPRSAFDFEYYAGRSEGWYDVGYYFKCVGVIISGIAQLGYESVADFFSAIAGWFGF